MRSVLHVLHLVGSPTSAFHADLSRLYARDCLENTADPDRYRFTVAHVSPGGRWCFPTSLDALDGAPSLSLPEAVARLATLDVDVVVPQMFCLAGMTHYRALLDVLGLPYVGNPPDVMALGAHKGRARAIVAAAGSVHVPHGELVRPGERPSVAPPAVVKPVDADNSVGVTLVRERADYDVAVEDACTHADAALVETYVELGREVRCGIVVQDGELVCLPLEEYDMDPDRKPIRGYDDKLDRGGSGGSDLRLLAKDGIRSWIVDPDDPVTAPVWAAARACHTALGCRDYSLFDFRIDPDGRPWFLEAGLYCSFARQSVIAVMAQAAGIGLDRLFGAALEQSLADHRPPSST